MTSIRRLDVTGFRGVPQTQASLIFDGKSILLFGENGTGKSTFVDAIERLFCGRVSTLDGRQGISSDRHGPNIHVGPLGPSISATLMSPDVTVDLTMNFNQFSGLLSQYLDAAGQDLFILRRRQVLEFIDSQPRERYALLRPFLVLSEVEQVENALKQARNEAESTKNEAGIRVERLTEDLKRALGDVHLGAQLTEREAVAAVSQVLTAVGHGPLSALADVEDKLAELDAEISRFGDTTGSSHLLSAVSSQRELLQKISDQGIASLISACIKLRERETLESRVFYDDVLEDGIKWIVEEERTRCPLCEQPIDPTSVVTNSRARLHAKWELIALRQEASARLTDAARTVRSLREAIERALKAVTSLTVQRSGISSAPIELLSNAVASLDQELAKGLGSLDLAALERLATPLKNSSNERASVQSMIDRAQDLLDKLPSPDRAKQLLSVRQRIKTLLGLWGQLEAARRSYEAAKAELHLADTVYQRASEARREVVQELYDKLSKDIGDLYERLHPGENHGDIHLEVRDVGQGSANLRASFYDRKDEDPRGYYSDAHLDTLGICIFLALRRWHRRLYPQFNLLVLDDVLTSVDNAHSVRLAELLLSQFADYQVLLTTHDRIWFEHLRDIQARCGVSANYVDKVIHNWTIEGGPDLREPEDERDRLNKLMGDGSSNEIASMAGRLLEHTLQEMRYNLSLSVQAKRSERYEIGELWPPFYKTAKRQYPSFYAQARPWLDSLDINWTVRNWVGAHFNDWARQVSRTSAIDFAKAVAGLFDLVFCPECRRFIAPSVAPVGQLACRLGHLIYPAPGREKAAVLDRATLAKESEGALSQARFDTSQYFEQKRLESTREQ